MGDSPAFQFYPADWLVGTLTFSLTEEAAYLRCVMHQWGAGFLPGDDTRALARIMRVGERDASKLWAVVRTKFERGDDGLWRNSRLERERQKQADYRQSRIESGRRGGLAKAKRESRLPTISLGVRQELASVSLLAKPLAKSSSSSSSSSLSSEPSSTKSVELAHDARAMTPIRHPSSLDWDRQHGKHVIGFCDWVCLPQSVFDEFVRRVIASGADEVQASMRVLEWASGVRAAWVGRIPGADIFDFWRHEWAATYGSNKPAASAGIDPLGGVREALRHV